MTTLTTILLLLLFCAIISSSTVQAAVVISEISDSGTSNACNGEDWVELFNNGPDDMDMTDMLLTDDKGWEGANAEPFYFPSGYVLQADTYLLMCGGSQIVPTGVNGTASLLPFPFGIGDDDTLQLILVQPQGDGTTRVQTQSIVGPLPGSPNDKVEDVTYALDPATGLYSYTSTPTPNQPNVITPIPSTDDLAVDKKTKLAAQNDQGIDFFNFDRQGKPVPNGMDAILELRITMNDADYQALETNPQYQDYQDFQEATIVTEDGVELLTLTDPGEIRTRGTEGTYMAACLGSPLPFRLDFDTDNKTQTLFGVQRIYLRHPLFDPSFMREWAYPRMLARFGMPHVRTRMVHFYINEQLQGLYTLMEIPEEEYVFARNFPDYDPNNFALFQTTPLTEGCGQYTQAQLDAAMEREDDSGTPPYAFERGEHKNRVTKLGEDKLEECNAAYQDYYDNVLMEDVVLAYVRRSEVCSDLFLEEGLLDQELGTDNWDKEINEFIQEYMAFKRCDPGCTNFPANDLDAENFLRMFAFYAVVLNIDSPIANAHNFYLAQQSNNDKKWKLLSYDFDKPGAVGCNQEVCDERLIHWSITRPTCESLEGNSLVGPLLTNATLQSQYLGYVREFIDDVYTNTELTEEIQKQASAIEDAVKASFGGGASFDDELTPDAASWDTGNFPLLPTMKARAEDLRKQLAALEDGTFPRNGMESTAGEAWETCADWQVSQPHTSACAEGCQYDGCIMSGWTVEYFCDEATGTCYHGDEDQGCEGIADGDMHAGMSGEDSFCRFTAGIPVKTSECLAVGGDLQTEIDEDPSTTSSGTKAFVGGGWACLIGWAWVLGAVF